MAFTTAMQVRTTPERLKRWKRLAKREGLTVSDMVRDAIDHWAKTGMIKAYKRVP